jgi:hypothetical protein
MDATTAILAYFVLKPMRRQWLTRGAAAARPGIA